LAARQGRSARFGRTRMAKDSTSGLSAFRLMAPKLSSARSTQMPTIARPLFSGQFLPNPDRSQSPTAVSRKREYFKCLPETIGDFAPKAGQFRNPETDSQLARARHWRAFLRSLRAKSPCPVAGWGGRIRTSVWWNQNQRGSLAISIRILTKSRNLPLDISIG
jgi:hypothetical protein